MAKMIYILAITVGFLVADSGRSAVSYKENGTMMVLENFKNSLTWADSVSMKVDIAVTPKGIPGKGPYNINSG